MCGELMGIYYYIYGMATIKFLIKGDSNASTIYLRFKDGRRFDLTAKTNFIVNSKNWSVKKGQPLNQKDDSSKKLHNDLVNLSADLLSHYNNTPNKLEINTQWLKDFINPPIEVAAVSDSLIGFIDYYYSLQSNKVTKSTLKRLKSNRNLIKSFEDKSNVLFKIKDVNLKFIDAFVKHCELNNYGTNYIARLVKFIKTVCFNARILNIEVSNQIDAIKPPMTVSVDNTYLTTDELNKIDKLKCDDDLLSVAKDWLLISCETGQRISDFMRFNKNMIRYEKNTKGKSIPLIEFKQIKTSKQIAVPLSKRVIQILNKRSGSFPPIMVEQTYNSKIKEVCKLAELNEPTQGAIIESNKKIKRKIRGVYPKWQLVASHIGRRSYATNNFGIIPTSLLKSVTGHGTEKMFLAYINKTNTENAKLLAEYY